MAERSPGEPAHLGIDARKIFDGGIGRHIREITRRLPEVLPGWRISLLVPPGSASLLDTHGISAPRFRLVEESAGKYGVRELWRLPRHAKRLGCDLMHVPHYVLPPGLPCPSVVTVHDLIHLAYPRTPLHWLYARLVIGGACKRASAIVTVSEHSAEELQRRLRVDRARVTVIHNGVTRSPSAATWKGGGGYVLYVGSLKPHKNLEWVVEAFREVATRSGLELWLAGQWIHEGRYRRRLERRVAELGLSRRVRFLGMVSERVLGSLQAHAELQLAPSLAEGFGFTALEGIALGVPVVASRGGGQPEVLGDGVRYVSGTDAPELARVVLELTGNAAARVALGARGWARAGALGWDEAALATAGVYRRILNR